MPLHNIQSPSRPVRPAAAALVLQLARTLHKAATSNSRAMSLPVLRRLLATATLRDIGLPGLYRQREMLQRKHILRMLALEAGFTSWEQYRPKLDTMTPAQLVHFDLTQGRASYPNIWFSSQAEARAHASRHGGLVMTVGRQAVVIPELMSAVAVHCVMPWQLQGAAVVEGYEGCAPSAVLSRARRKKSSRAVF